MDLDERREASWDRAVDAHGTYEIFARRKRLLSRRTRLRDFLGFLVPILIAAVATAEWIGKYKAATLASLAVAGLVQAAITVWSFVSRWDEALGYSNRATRDSADLRDSWENIARGRSSNPEFDYKVESARQRITDAFDAEQGLEGERKYGMRSALFHFRRACGNCCRVPYTRRARFWWVFRQCCDNCGEPFPRSAQMVVPSQQIEPREHQ